MYRFSQLPTPNSRFPVHTCERGQAAMMMVLFFLIASLAVVFGFVHLAVTQASNVQDLLDSHRSFYAAESVLEDVAYRNLSAIEDADEAGYNLIFSYAASPEARFETETLPSGLEKFIAVASLHDTVRKTNFQLSPGVAAGFTHDLQVGGLGLELINTASVKGQVFSNGPIKGVGSDNNKIILRAGGHATVAMPSTNSPDVLGKNDSGASAGAIAFRDHASEDNLGQQFIVDETGWLDQVSIKVARCNFTNSGVDITVKILGNIDPSGGSVEYLPDHANVLGTVNVPWQNITQNDTACTGTSYAGTGATTWFNIDFTSQNIALQKWRPYWLVLHSACGAGNCSRYYLLDSTANTEYDQTSALDEPYESHNNFTVKFNASDTSYAWCNPGSGCTSQNNTNPNGARDLMFRMYINTARSKISGVKIEHCVNANNGAGDNDPCDGTPSAVGCDGYIDANTVTGVNAAAEMRYGASESGNTTSCSKINTGGQQERRDPPFDATTIQNWITKAKQNGPCDTSGSPDCSGSGDVNISGSEIRYFPHTEGSNDGDAWITRDVNIQNSGILEINDYLYIEGDLICQNDGLIHIGGTTAKNLSIVVEGRVEIKNDCIVRGVDGFTNSHLMIVSLDRSIDNNAPAILLQNGGAVDIFYAANGMVTLQNSGEIHAVYGEGVYMKNSAQVISFFEGVTGGVIFEPTGLETSGVLIPSNWGEGY